MESIKRAFLCLAILSLTSVIARAQSRYSASQEPANVNFVKHENGQLYFMVKYSDTSASRVQVSLFDDLGENLYRGYFPGKNFRRIFRVPDDLHRLVVVIRNPDTKAEYRFKINSESRIVRDAFVLVMK